jgi:predicted lipid-binding transport protein (Tim44 family)
MENVKQEIKGRGASGVIFVGCLLLGLAVGFLIGNIVAGLFGGLGVGLIAMGIARAVTGSW